MIEPSLSLLLMRGDGGGKGMFLVAGEDGLELLSLSLDGMIGSRIVTEGLLFCSRVAILKIRSDQE